MPVPSYPLFDHLTRLDGVAPRPYPLEYHGAWSVDSPALERAVTARTRAVLVVSPNNPTGLAAAAATISTRLAALCAARGLALIGDEVFADYLLEPARRPRRRAGPGRRADLRLGGLSKSVGLPQVKLGWIAVGGPAAAARPALARLELICDTYLSVSTPVQLAAGALLAAGRERPAPIRDAHRGEPRSSCSTAAAGAPSCSVLRAEGGWSAVLRVPATRAEESLVLELLEHDGVLVHPGYFFDFPREAFLVVSLLPPTAAVSPRAWRGCSRASTSGS